MIFGMTLTDFIFVVCLISFITIFFSLIFLGYYLEYRKRKEKEYAKRVRFIDFSKKR